MKADDDCDISPHENVRLAMATTKFDRYGVGARLPDEKRSSREKQKETIKIDEQRRVDEGKP